MAAAPNIDELRAATECAQAHARVLEEQLDQLDPRAGGYRRRLGIELPDRMPPEEEGGADAYLADVAHRRAAYLHGRFVELTAQRDRQQRAAQAAYAGLDRFAGPGRRTLDELLEGTREERRRRTA